MATLCVMPDASEVIHYDRNTIPLYIRPGLLSTFPNMRALCHWHEDFEFIRILEGEMNYFIGKTVVLLKKGDCLFVNAKQLHYGYSNKNRECEFTCILVHPSALTGNQTIYHDFILPLQNDLSTPYLKFTSKHPDYATILEGLDYIFALKNEGKPTYELEALGTLLKLTSTLFANRTKTSTPCETENSRLSAHKKMVAFIAMHFSEDITLADIAASASVSKSTCCRMFKKYTSQSPFDFLTTYRLHVSCDLLENTDKSITEIAGLCGFNHVSYYSHLFLEAYGCQPHKYRLQKGCRKTLRR